MDPHCISAAIATWAASTAMPLDLSSGDILESGIWTSYRIERVAGPFTDGTGSWWTALVTETEGGRGDDNQKVLHHLRRGGDGLIRQPNGEVFLPLTAGRGPTTVIPVGSQVAPAECLSKDPFCWSRGIRLSLDDAVVFLAEDGLTQVVGTIVGIRSAWALVRSATGADRIIHGSNLVHQDRAWAHAHAWPHLAEDRHLQVPTFARLVETVDAEQDRLAAPVVDPWCAAVADCLGRPIGITSVADRARLRGQRSEFPPVGAARAQHLADLDAQLAVSWSGLVGGRTITLEVQDHATPGTVHLSFLDRDQEVTASLEPDDCLVMDGSAAQSYLKEIASHHHTWRERVNSTTKTGTRTKGKGRGKASKAGAAWQAAIAALPPLIGQHPAVAAVIAKHGTSVLSVDWALEDLRKATAEAQAAMEASFRATIDGLVEALAPVPQPRWAAIQSQGDAAGVVVWDQAMRIAHTLTEEVTVLDHGDGWWSSYIAGEGTHGGISSTGYKSLTTLAGRHDEDVEDTPTATLALRHREFLAEKPRARDPNDHIVQVIDTLATLLPRDDSRRGLLMADHTPVEELVRALNAAWDESLEQAGRVGLAAWAGMQAKSPRYEDLLALGGILLHPAWCASRSQAARPLRLITGWLSEALSRRCEVVREDGSTITVQAVPQIDGDEYWSIVGDRSSLVAVPAAAVAVLGDQEVARLVLEGGSVLRQALIDKGLVEPPRPRAGRGRTHTEEDGDELGEEDDLEEDEECVEDHDDGEGEEEQNQDEEASPPGTVQAAATPAAQEPVAVSPPVAVKSQTTMAPIAQGTNQGVPVQLSLFDAA